MFDIEPGRDYAVITGDVIDSSSLTAPERKGLPDLIHSVGATLTDWLTDQAITPVALFGGDSWQVLVADPGNSLRVSLFIRASLLASPLNIDTRFAVAIGGVDFVPPTGVEEADGEAFRASGRLLNDGLPARCSAGFVHADAELAERWRVVYRLVDVLCQTNWTANRARAVSGALRGLTGSEIGELWPSPISKQTVSRHLLEAGWESIEEAVHSEINFWGRKSAQ